jgi:hypothetical protein
MALGIGISGPRGGGGGAIPSLSIEVYSDAGFTTPIISDQFGQTVYIKAVSTGSVTSYLFIARLNDDFYFIDENGTGEVTWSIDVPVGNIEIIVIADDVIANLVAFEISGLLLDAFPTCNGAFSVRKLRSLYAGSCMTVRRSSDSATLAVGFVLGELDTASIVTFVGVGNGFDAIWYDQTSTGNASQVTANDQPFIAISGAVTTVGGVPTVTFTTSREFMSMTARTVISGFVVERKASNTNLVQYLIGGTEQGLASGGTYAGASNIALATAGGIINTTVNDTLNHQVSFNTGTAGTASIYVDGALAASGTTSASMTISMLGSRPDFTTFTHIGSISEIIIFPDNQVPNRVTIEASQQTYFGTP